MLYFPPPFSLFIYSSFYIIVVTFFIGIFFIIIDSRELMSKLEEKLLDLSSLHVLMALIHIAKFPSLIVSKFICNLLLGPFLFILANNSRESRIFQDWDLSLLISACVLFHILNCWLKLHGEERAPRGRSLSRSPGHASF